MADSKVDKSIIQSITKILTEIIDDNAKANKKSIIKLNNDPYRSGKCLLFKKNPTYFA